MTDLAAPPTDQPTEQMTAARALNSALDLAMEADPRVVLLGEDIADPIGGVFKVSKGLSTKYGTQRVRATPISEQAIVGSAVGLALAGYRPVAEVMFFDFVLIAADQLVNHAAKLRYMSGGHTPCPLVVRTVVGGQRFGAQHSQSLEAWFMHVPGLKVVMPCSPADHKGLLAAAIEDDDPVLFIEHINLVYSQKQDVPVGPYRIPLGQAAVVRPGRHATIVTYGPAVPTSLAAAGVLAERGVDIEVVDLRSLVPLDVATVLDSVGRTGRAVVVHEATTFAGPGAEIAAQISEQLFGDLLAPVLRVGAAFTPTPFASALNNRPTVDDVVAAVVAVARPS